jgi:hypothetical protein
MARTFLGIRENWGRHVSVEKYEGGTRRPLGEWPSPKKIFRLKKKLYVCVCVFVSSCYILIRINL